jgi:hypothetical protein
VDLESKNAEVDPSLWKHFWVVVLNKRHTLETRGSKASHRASLRIKMLLLSLSNPNGKSPVMREVALSTASKNLKTIPVRVILTHFINATHNIKEQEHYPQKMK